MFLSVSYKKDGYVFNLKRENGQGYIPVPQLGYYEQNNDPTYEERGVQWALASLKRRPVAAVCSKTKKAVVMSHDSIIQQIVKQAIEKWLDKTNINPEWVVEPKDDDSFLVGIRNYAYIE